MNCLLYITTNVSVDDRHVLETTLRVLMLKSVATNVSTGVQRMMFWSKRSMSAEVLNSWWSPQSDN